MPNKNIVFIGFMGCGKTTLGRQLARLIGYEFFDTDKFIECQEAMRVSEIFAKYGELYFRNKESEVCNILSEKNSCIIATGGGIIRTEKNIELLKKSGIIVYLEAEVSHLYNNLARDNSRPLLNVKNKKSKISELLDERIPIYKAAADLTIHMDDDTVENNTRYLLEMLKKEGLF